MLNYFSEYHKHRPAIEETDFLDLMPGELFYEIATEIGWAPKLDTQTNENSRDMLAKIPFFRGLDAYSKVQICGELKILTVGKLKKDGRPQSRADATIIREGQVGTDMFVIIEGLVAVEIEEKRLGFLGQHHFFGELAALLPPEPGSWGRPHHRTHYAVEDCTLGVLSHEDMMKLREKRLEIDEAVSPFVAEALRCTMEDTKEEKKEKLQAYYDKHTGTSHSRFNRMEAKLEKRMELIEAELAKRLDSIDNKLDKILPP